MRDSVRALADHPFLFATISLLVCALAAGIGYGTGLEGLQAVTRYTGRAGLLWFSIVFTLAAGHRFAAGEATRDALRIGLGFGLHHSVHLILLLMYIHASGNPLVLSRAAGGMFGYLLLFAMMATSNDGAVRRLGPMRWRTLHQAGLWYLWIVFVLTYLPRLQGKLPQVGGGPIEFAVCMILLIVLASVRVSAFVKGKIGTHPSAPAA